MPIGDNAIYVPAYLEYETKFQTGVDENIINMKSDAPPVNVYYSDALWNASRDRCEHDDRILATIPFPHDWIISRDTWRGTTPNAAMAVLTLKN